MTGNATPTPDDQGKESAERIRNLVTLWTHQNTLLWGRLQTITAVQVAIIGGWYALFARNSFVYAALLTALGTALSFTLGILISCDLDWRRDIGDRLKKADPMLLPSKVDNVSGWRVISGIAKGFWTLDLVLFVLSCYAVSRACANCCAA